MRGLSSRNVDNANRVLNVKGSGTVKVAHTVPLRSEVNYMKAFNQTVNGVALVASSGTIKLKTGTRPLANGEYLVRWDEGHRPNARFVLESDEPINSRFRAIMMSNGVCIGFQQFMILVR